MLEKNKTFISEIEPLVSSVDKQHFYFSFCGYTFVHELSHLILGGKKIFKNSSTALDTAGADEELVITDWVAGVTGHIKNSKDN